MLDAADPCLKASPIFCGPVDFKDACNSIKLVNSNSVEFMQYFNDLKKRSQNMEMLLVEIHMWADKKTI